jgi:DNA-binding MurR/RpiR family transcriptional regulator
MTNPIIHLKDNLHKLTNSQRTVANYILEHPMEVAFLTVDQLARKVRTSTTTIMRLAFNLGYTGYAEFQKELQKDLRSQAAPKTRFEANLLDRENEDLWSTLVNHHLQHLQSTYELISLETLDQVVDGLAQSSKIYLTNVRSGMPIAQFLYHGLNRALGNVKLIPADQIEWVDEIISMKEGDILIAVSFPRYSTRLLELLDRAKQKGVKIISITDSYSSPLVKYSDTILPATSNSLSFHNSLIPAMVIADYLVSAVSIHYPEQTKKRLDELNNILTSVNYHYL